MNVLVEAELDEGVVDADNGGDKVSDQGTIVVGEDLVADCNSGDSGRRKVWLDMGSYPLESLLRICHHGEHLIFDSDLHFDTGAGECAQDLGVRIINSCFCDPESS